MIWKSFIIAFLAVGASAVIEISQAQYNSVWAKMNAYCKMNGAEDKTDDATAAVITFVNSTSTLLNPTTVQKEISDALWLNNENVYRDLFKKYCSKVPQLKSNLHTLSTGLLPCYSEDDRTTVDLSNNGTDRLLDYLCDNEAEKITLFFTDGGMQCYQKQTAPIVDCYVSHVQNAVPSMEMAKKMTVREQCAMLDSFSICVVKVLRNCSTSSASDITKNVIKIARDTVPCP